MVEQEAYIFQAGVQFSHFAQSAKLTEIVYRFAVQMPRIAKEEEGNKVLRFLETPDGYGIHPLTTSVICGRAVGTAGSL